MTKFALLWVLAAAGQDTRLPVPDAASQKEKEALVREILKSEFAKKSTRDRLALAQQLLEQAGATQDDRTAQYVLYREAKEQAAAAGDLATAYRAIAELAKVFRVEPEGLKLGVLTVIAQDAKLPEAGRTTAEGGLRLADEADDADELDTAEKAVTLAATAARRIKDIPLITRAEARLRLIADQKARKSKVESARQILASHPDDPAANLEVGQYECFVRGHWEGGLPLLGRSSSEVLRALALKDLSDPQLSSEQAAVGDGWRERSEKETLGRGRLRERAAYWYQKAIPAATGLLRIRIEKSLGELARSGTVLPHGKDISPDGLVGWWTFDEGSGTTAGDSSGNKNPGKLVGDSAWVPEHLGQAVQFKEAGSRVTVPDVPALRLTGDLSISLWFRKDQAPSDWARLVGKGDFRTRNYGLWAGAPFHGNQVMFQQWDDSGRQVVVLNGHSSVNLGRWYHVAAVVRGEEAALYLDGALEASGKRSGTPATSADPLTIGFPGWLVPFAGAVDDVRIYKRAITEEEIGVLSSMR